MAADLNGTATQGSLLRLTTQLRQQLKVLVDASAALARRSAAWKPEARDELGRVRQATERLLALVGPSVACPKCQQPLAYLPQHQGKKVRCVPCGHKFRLAVEPPAPTLVAPSTPPAGPAKRKRNNRLVLAASATVLALAVVVLGCALWNSF